MEDNTAAAAAPDQHALSLEIPSEGTSQAQANQV
jgi:hypothetical protein